MAESDNKIIVTPLVADPQIEALLTHRHGHDIHTNTVVGSFAPTSFREPLNTAFLPMAITTTLTETAGTYANDRYRLVGLSFGGDDADTPCDVEHEELAYQWRRLVAGLQPNLSTPGNHGGGSWMGYIYDVKNRMHTPPFNSPIKRIYANVIEDGVLACGVREAFTTKAEATSRHFDLTHMGSDLTLADVTVPMDLKNWISGAGRVQEWVESKTPLGQRQWDININIDRGRHEKNRTARRIAHEKMADDVRSTVELQAVEKASFATDTSPQALRVIQIAANTGDLTEAGLDTSMEDGNGSTGQVQTILGFMDRRLRENPNTVFPLLMHIPTQEWTPETLENFRPLLEREEVSWVYFAHAHWQGLEDLREKLHLDRKTSLYATWIPSPADRSTLPQDGIDTYAEMLWEEMEWVETEAGGQLQIMIRPARLSVHDLPGISEVMPLLEAFGNNHGFTQLKEATAGLNEDLQRVVHRGSKRDLFKTAIKLLRLPGTVPDYLNLHATLKKLCLDAEGLTAFLQDVTIPLLMRESHTKYAEALTRYVSWLEGRKTVWEKRLAELQEMRNSSRAIAIWQREEKILEKHDKEAGYDMDELFHLLNTLPDGSLAKTAALAARMRAVEEEFAYKTSGQLKDYICQMPQRAEPYLLALDFSHKEEGEGLVASAVSLDLKPEKLEGYAALTANTP